MGDLLGITFRQLQAFLRIAELGTFAAAADALGMAPPSISGHMRALEARCGPLFERLPGGRVRLTEAGATLRIHATALLAELQALSHGLARTAAPAPTIRIAATDFLHGRIKEIAADFLLAHPAVAIHATAIGDADEGMETLRQARVDLFFVTRVAAEPEDPATLLGPAAAGLFATPALVRAHSLGRPDATLPILVAGSAAEGAGMVETVLRLAGVRAFEIAGRAQHVQISRAMCVRGAGVALLYDELVREELASGALMRLPPPIRCLWRHCHVRPAGHSAAAEAFLDFARARLIASDSL